MLACYACARKLTKTGLGQARRAEFTAVHDDNVLIPMCTDHAWEIANMGGTISPIPGTEDTGVSK